MSPRPKSKSDHGGFGDALDHAVFEELLASAQDAIVLIDRQGRILRWNQAAERIFGHSSDEIMGRDVHCLLAPPGTRTDALVAMQRFESTGEGAALGRTLELKGVHRDGGPIPVELSLSSVKVAGRWFGLAVIRDITESHRLKHALERTERNFSSVVELNRAGILVLDRYGSICFANDAAQILLDRHVDELIGEQFGMPAGQLRAEVAVRRKDGSRGTAEMSATETEWEGQPAYLVMLHDVTELKDAEATARFLSLHDMLTGLPNRRLFHERLERALERARRDGEGVALLFMDLNRFKAINDGLGHDAGDEILRAFGQRLSRCLRASDTVARLGGDEFCALVEGLKSPGDLEAVAAKLQDCLSKPFRVCDTDLFVGSSIGVALYPSDATDADTLLRRADSAMYAAKRSGSDHFRLFAASMEKEDVAALRLEQLLHVALERGELHLVYQPIVRVSDRTMTGMEALLRWKSPDLGDVPPERFIPVLENNGGIKQVGLWVVEQVCAQLATWQDAGLKPVPVAVNVSAVQLVDRRFPDLVQRILLRFAIQPDLLTMELTETAVIDDEDAGTVALERLSRLGVWLHMDDFGTGWSSLGLLRKLPFDAIKIDRSFVADIANSHADALLVAGIVSMAHSLNKRVIAEGVETETHLALLKDYHCDYAQGWLLGHPVGASQTVRMLLRAAHSADRLDRRTAE
ncbi:putative bifunctional diguanylate cyclase/phosphodiesterase [Thiocapsa bogorovii]|uniref:putative bifunctional diguanylate cyclase/phosphodiesterase n=1 Tax=Thiocapsa bogorovii TaxID=521689 RepID=UPI001E568B84|nr:EAL domain-containing protein [Thiocapsa bogorovii]UHD15156.1 EAL domain-containing protein [Thiocapsa bogorovii]